MTSMKRKGRAQLRWLKKGVKRGFCSNPVCDTHDGLPMREEEVDAWDEGDDICIPAVRLYRPDEMPVENNS